MIISLLFFDVYIFVYCSAILQPSFTIISPHKKASRIYGYDEIQDPEHAEGLDIALLGYCMQE